ncbi:uncharacterized protein SPAPADRAFT_63020 [Spathaspora passalidarum NRRL Y-27907]|uniref:Uncharacterized protein n=1 Tax=Spathaspora passalidarum (strain NRRL Y-27907 / 11-Y1) TaxID=619300 RepID=G3ASH5_SPAPN|nr:uncharacterized protein SPAPADRAFT_63020 [Spathaspora passalidarum NRRL Y-27907]EGW31093.1 hypothetical protein SPAPADRAFT_63020 [Spathaspora passalidarum NRRL Y-27907]
MLIRTFILVSTFSIHVFASVFTVKLYSRSVNQEYNGQGVSIEGSSLVLGDAKEFQYDNESKFLFIVEPGKKVYFSLSDSKLELSSKDKVEVVLVEGHNRLVEFKHSDALYAIKSESESIISLGYSDDGPIDGGIPIQLVYQNVKNVDKTATEQSITETKSTQKIDTTQQEPTSTQMTNYPDKSDKMLSGSTKSRSFFGSVGKTLVIIYCDIVFVYQLSIITFFAVFFFFCLF